jgi:hypothetical protein
MLTILTWMWHDPLLQGSRGVRPSMRVVAPRIRQDMMLSMRRKKKLLAAGKTLPPEPAPELPPLAPGTPRSFKPKHVERLAELFRKHLPVPHRFVCISDEVPAESNGVTWVPIPAAALAMRSLRSPEGNRFPSCYMRLWAQSREAAALLGERCLLVDIDLVPVRDLTPIVSRDEPFVGWRPFRDWGKKSRIGGGIYLFTPGSNAQVWDDFHARPQAAIAEACLAGFRGSDQAWLSHKLAGKVPVYGRDSGIYSIRDLGTDHALPADARLVQMNGPAHCKPWSYRGPAAWVAEHWGGK